jgi:hypothetical protein
MVGCSECGSISIASGSIAYATQKARERWNTRATSDLERQRDALAEALDKMLSSFSAHGSVKGMPDDYYAGCECFKCEAIKSARKALAQLKEGGV